MGREIRDPGGRRGALCGWQMPSQLNSHAGGCRPYPSVRSYPDEIELVRVPGFLRQWIRVVQDPCMGGWKSHGQGQGQLYQDNGST